jgi:hypothetical protein
VHHIHVRIRKWVIWWLALGMVFGAVALLNILLRDLSRMQDKVILIVGILHWVLGGLVCWAYDGIKVDAARPPQRNQPARIEVEREWHSASDFVQPGARKSMLPPRY